MKLLLTPILTTIAVTAVASDDVDNNNNVLRGKNRRLHLFGNKDKEQKYELGQGVLMQWLEGWYHGKIISYENGKYSVEWCDGELSEYGDTEKLEMAVQTFNENPTTGCKDEDLSSNTVENTTDGEPYEPIPEHTQVYKKFNDGWYAGEIFEYAEENRIYTVKYKDGSLEAYKDDQELHEIIQNAGPPIPQFVDTLSLMEDGWHWGQVSAYNGETHEYTVKYWNDNDNDYTGREVKFKEGSEEFEEILENVYSHEEDYYNQESNASHDEEDTTEEATEVYDEEDDVDEEWGQEEAEEELEYEEEEEAEEENEEEEGN